MLLIAVCLFASVYTAIGMRTVYYRDGQVCDACTEEHGGVAYKQSYTPEEAGRRVIYSGQERIISRPISSSSYIDRADYSPRNLSSFLYYSSLIFCLTLSFNLTFFLISDTSTLKMQQCQIIIFD